VYLVHPMVDVTDAPSTYWRSPYLPCTSQAQCLRLKAGMRQDLVQHRTGRSFGSKAPAHRADSKRAGHRSAVRLRQAGIAVGRKRRRPLFFYAVAATVVGELAAIVVDMEALVLLFSLTGLLLCAAVFQSAQT
jgi:hypothetical protein